ncbi:hypothetical protein PTTG_26748 [Puccinia triticina 1-1 BBBD Race 1]|uniref:CxC1 domain-containing protein n=2 Tax=Puccinia triticina TaxID=208348 RepID=A0A180GRT1_PUCT1|nr:uncharacterized protein PtA15_11A278 [Puccinia triticina]OAV95234.1 hypothetical protein PTTG_26748 [Puccinia triticina 1-1 BBBD Race 1]WAQ89588.1 hypothetical protein PtA15_11A278 [Puccinia triticina]
MTAAEKRVQEARDREAERFREWLDSIKVHHKQVAKQEKQRRADKLISALHAAYLALQAKTNNWSSPNRFQNFSNDFCKCDRSKVKDRRVNLIDLDSRRREQIRFCCCASDNLHLLARGYIGASPFAPHTAFSIPLLRSYIQLWKQCEAGNLPVGTQVWLEAKFGDLLTPSGNRQRFQRHFPIAVGIYGALLDRSNETPEDTLNLTKEEAAGLVSCPVCSGRTIRESRETSPNEINRPL